MKTRQQITTRGPEHIVVKSRIPRVLHSLIIQAAEDLGLNPIQAWGLLLVRIAGEIEDGRTGFLGTEFVRAARTLSMKDELGTVKGLPPIDHTLLERSDRAKSGYVGVYQNNVGFRAEAKNPNGPGMVNVGNYPTTPMAAWARQCFCKQHNIPYGEASDKLKEFWKLVEECRSYYPDTEAQTDENYLLGLLDGDAYGRTQVEKMTKLAHEVGIKFGSIDGTKKSHALFEPFRGDGTDAPSVAGELIPVPVPLEPELIANRKFLASLANDGPKRR